MYTHDMTGYVSETVWQNKIQLKKSQYGEICPFTYILLHCETDVDQEIASAAGDKKRRGGRKEDSDLRVCGQEKKKRKKEKKKKLSSMGSWQQTEVINNARG
jgi:hypothetical protein